MDTISIEVKRLKNIEHAFLEFPLVKGTSVIVGGNGSGKSTVLLALSQAFMRGSLRQLDEDDFDQTSEVAISISDDKRVWSPNAQKGWCHHALYTDALAAVQSGSDLPANEVWVCPVCGNTVYGTPPDKCPLVRWRRPRQVRPRRLTPQVKSEAAPRGPPFVLQSISVEVQHNSKIKSWM